MSPPTTERPESLPDVIATIIQTGHVARLTSDEIAQQVIQEFNRSAWSRPRFVPET